MESSDTPTNKRTPLEELSKDELIKKCNNLLLIAKKAKQAKDESSEELKKYKENETKLSSDVAALKEVVESFNKKQTEFAEVQNKHKLSEEKNSELKKDFRKLEEKYASKITECSMLEETLRKLSDKVSKLELVNSEYLEKLNDFKENYAKVDIENKSNIEKLKECQKNDVDLRKKLQMAEEKYIKLEVTLKEFQGKYMDECKSHEELQGTLIRLQNRSSSDEKDAALGEVNERLKTELAENERLLKELKGHEVNMAELRKNYDSAIMEKDKLIEICQSDKSTEELFKANISKLKEELKALREENDVADKRYKEMEMKLEESRVISELLKKEIDGKCDEYDAFKKEMEFYKLKNNELNKEIQEKEKQCLDYKSRCDELNEAEKQKSDLIENLRKELLSTRDSLTNAEEKLGETLREKDKTNQLLQESFSFESIPLTNDRYKNLLQKYIKDKNVVDSSLLIEDLDNISVEVKKLRNGPTKRDQATEMPELDDRQEHTEGHVRKQEELKEKLMTLGRTATEIRSFKTKINEEVRDSFSRLRTENVKVTQDITRKISEVLSNLQNGNQELLSEMNVMNQALKERGEAISKLEKINESQNQELLEADAKISQLDSKLSEKKKKINQLFEELEQTKSDLENKEKAIKEMEEEIWKLKNSDPHGETLSSSTISRVDEAARLMDVEESFEERYSKLKNIAAKLKKKVTDQQKQLEEERSKSISKTDELQAKISNMQSQIKSLMNLVPEYERLQDEYEEEQKNKSQMKKVLDSANEKIDALKQEVEDLKKEKEKLLNDKSGSENIKKKLSAQIITLKAVIEEEKTKQTKLEKEMEKVEQERTLKEKKLEEEKEKHKATMSLFEKQKMETKNLGVLKLEIAEYEKSVGDLGKKLTMKDDELKELNLLLENQRSQCKLYLDEITHLKSQLTQENERATEASMQVQKFNEESSSREVEFKEKLSEIGFLKNTIEEKKKEVEEMSLELARISQEKLKAEEKCKNTQDHCSREIHSLQDMVGNLQDSLNQRDLELSELKKEFEAYKVRAQSVLRQSQKEMNQSKQRNVMEELEQLRSTSTSLNARLKESGLKMQKLVEENEVFQEEKNRLYTRIQELKNSLAEVRAENQELKQNKQKELEQHGEAMKLQKLQSETLAHCYQKKIEELEASHKAKIEELTKDQEQMQKQFQKLMSSVNERSERRDLAEHKRNLSGFIPVKSDKEMLDVMLLEREECEGSESVESISPQTGNNTNLIPLDQLLNSSDNLEQLEEKRSPVQDINQLNDRLEKSENRIKHLTVLLSEAETDCARLQHLNDVLKEEIRRNQRNIEREQHAQNFEYMKNVVLKFLTLHNTDEKIRLVPVLNTILKLSPEEETVLSNAAKGIVEHSSSNRGWGSYLNIWPSGQ
ncbi:UNVERIFIED_CONTAM: hypothetical protein PYX00_002312 [Menopon gallinae]|uniref:GRIP domain-containing protein n=1 Tax=Menopon gallinae TaxID=328185 RepID=A0AAW2IHP8_9NEOP